MMLDKCISNNVLVHVSCSIKFKITPALSTKFCCLVYNVSQIPVCLFISDVEQMISSRDENGSSILHVSAALGSAAGLRLLLEDLPVDTVREMLEMGSLCNRTPLLHAACNKTDPEVIRILLEFIREKFPPPGMCGFLHYYHFTVVQYITQSLVY